MAYPMIKLEGGWFIETWYNRREMAYVSVLKDGESNQVGDSYYDGHSSSVPSSRNSLIDRYTNESGFSRPTQYVNSKKWGNTLQVKKGNGHDNW